MTSAAATVDVPRLEHTGRVTQARVAVSEWTKLHSLRSTRWSLLVATVLGDRPAAASSPRSRLRTGAA